MEAMRYVIMANGQGRRWGDYLGKPKHLIEIDGETLLRRTTRLVKQADPAAEVYISSSSPASETQGAIRHSPLHSKHELDRFCYELITPHVCFLYGDTFYTEETLETIVDAKANPLAFFGNNKSIVGVKSLDDGYLKELLDTLFERIERGEIADAKGWDLFHLAQERSHGIDSAELFVHVTGPTQDFNSPCDYLQFKAQMTGERQNALPETP